MCLLRIISIFFICGVYQGDKIIITLMNKEKIRDYLLARLSYTLLISYSINKESSCTCITTINYQ